MILEKSNHSCDVSYHIYDKKITVVEEIWLFP